MRPVESSRRRATSKREPSGDQLGVVICQVTWNSLRLSRSAVRVVLPEAASHINSLVSDVDCVELEKMKASLLPSLDQTAPKGWPTSEMVCVLPDSG